MSTKPDTLYVKNISFYDKILKFNINDTTATIPIKRVLSINFHTNKPHEIIIQSDKLDTIECSIDYISPDKIHFHSENGIPQTIDKYKIFGVAFNKNQVIPEITKLKNAYFQLYISKFKENFELFRKDGSEIELLKLRSINEENIIFETSINDEITKVSIPQKDVQNINLYMPSNKKIKSTRSSYFFSKNSTWAMIYDIKEFQKDTIITTSSTYNNTSSTISKDNLYGLFFYDFKIKDSQLKNKNSYNNTKSQTQVHTLKIDVNTGFGYMLAPMAENISPDLKRYVNYLRLGVVFDANFMLYPTTYFGIGLKINQLKTNNIIPDVLEDNIAIKFIGGSLIINIPIAKNRSYLYSGISIGPVKETNNAKILNDTYYIEGSTICTYLNCGTDFLLTKNLAVGFQGGLMFGSIDEFYVNNKLIKPDVAESLLRLDGEIGIKIYL